MNTARLQQIKALILEEPQRFFMEGYGYLNGRPWGCEIEDMPTGWQEPPCKTAGCICGWANMLQNREENLPLDTHLSSHKRAGLWLDIPVPVWENYQVVPVGVNTDQVFYTAGWPREYRLAYENASTSTDRAKAAAAYIDYLCAQQEQEKTP